MSPSESSMPLIAFLLLTHARLQDNACAMSHDSYGNQRGNPLKSRNQQRNPEISEKSGNQREIGKSGNQ